MNAFQQAAKPRKRIHTNSAIDPGLLKITNDPPPEKRVMGEHKYGAIAHINESQPAIERAFCFLEPYAISVEAR